MRKFIAFLILVGSTTAFAQQLTFPEHRKPTNKDLLCRKMIEHTKNRDRMDRVIGDINRMQKSLLDFNADAILKEYRCWEKIFDILKIDDIIPKNVTRDTTKDYKGNDRRPRNLWVSFCKSIISIAKFIKKFNTIDDFDLYIDKFIKKQIVLIKLRRANINPIITPNKNHPWEAKATFNPAAMYLKGKVHLLYRAMSEDNTSVLGYATSRDGIHIDYRSPEPVYIPREQFEQKLERGGNSGTEDPRLVKIGSRIYMFYTAFDGKNPPRVAFTWIKEQDFLNKKWDWSRAMLISAPDLDDKDAAMFPEKIKGRYLIIHRVGDDIDFSHHKTLDFNGTNWLEEYRWIMPRKGRWDSRKVGVAAPPIKTKAGWLLLYHGISEEDQFYRVGAILVGLRDPAKIICRTDYPIFEPETSYEKEGEVSNVVFPCGAALIGKKLFVYYGGADKVVGVATVNIDELLGVLKVCKC